MEETICVSEYWWSQASPEEKAEFRRVVATDLLDEIGTWDLPPEKLNDLVNDLIDLNEPEGMTVNVVMMVQERQFTSDILKAVHRW